MTESIKIVDVAASPNLDRGLAILPSNIDPIRLFYFAPDSSLRDGDTSGIFWSSFS